MASNNIPIMGTKDTNNNEHPVSLPYGVCATAAATAAKTVSVPGVKSLTTDDAGTMICVKFTYTNSATSPTLNVNSLGAKNIVQYGTTAASTSAATTAWQAGSTVILIFDGTSWVFNKGYNTNTVLSLGSTATTAAKGNHTHTYDKLAVSVSGTTLVFTSSTANTGTPSA